MTSCSVRLTGILAGTLGLVLLPLSAHAQGQTPTKVAPIEVVATKLPEAPHDVPASIEVISGEDLRARGVASLRDALALAAGVAIAPGGDAGPASAVAEFWGLREFDAFLLVVDGVPSGGALNPAMATLSLRDVDRIEILRGAAPVTFGATSFVGVIHVVHNPAAATAKYMSFSGGTHSTGSGAVDVVVPSTGAWHTRASGDISTQGFTDERTSFGIAHALLRTARGEGDKQTWFTADLTFLRQDPASPHPRDGASLSTAVPLDANHNPSGARADETRYTFSAGITRAIAKNTAWSTTASFTHSEQKMFRGFLVDIADTPNNAAGFLENIDVNHIYLDSHIIWPAKHHMQFMTGADLLFANGEAEGATFDYTARLDGSTATIVPEPTTLDKDAADRRIFLGGYASTEWHLDPRFSLSGGIRLNATSERHDEADPSVSHTRLSGTIGAMYGLWEKGVDHVRLFANYRNTFKPAAFDFSLAENEDVLDPETSNSYEGGLKVRTHGGMVDFEVSAFRMDFTNLVTASEVNGVPELINSGKTRFQGAELAMDVKLAHATFLRGTYSYHDGKFVDFVKDVDGTLTQLAGKRIEMSARQLLSAGVTYAPDRGITFTAALNYTGSHYLDEVNTALAPGYATFDAGIGYRTARAEFRVDGHNLGDRRDPVSISELGDDQFYQVPARSVRAGVWLKY